MVTVEQFFAENLEGLEYWNIRPKFWLAPDGSPRPRGLSAMVRVKDEAEWIVASLDSIVGWCDEVAIFLQGEQTDGTGELVDAWADAHPDKDVCVYRYPFDSLPNGPGHDKQLRGSVRERAFFYNWCHSLTRYDHAMKWDGDMVALDWLGAAVRELMPDHDVIRFRGVDLVGDLKRMSVKPHTAREPRVWKVTPATYWYSGEKCEYFTFGHDDGYALQRDAFLHFKWAKDPASARKDWPANWRDVPHFQRIDARQNAGRIYSGEWPSVIERPR